MLKSLLVSLALIFTAPLAIAGQGGSTAAEALVTTAAEDIAESEQDQVADAVLSHIDTRAIANFTLGRYGRALPADDIARFATAFEDFLRRQIDANAHQFSGVDVDIIDTSARNARDSIVTTELKTEQDRMKVRWRVIERGGKWSVVDLEIAGIWLAIEQRAQVSAILARPGADIEDVIAQFG